MRGYFLLLAILASAQAGATSRCADGEKSQPHALIDDSTAIEIDGGLEIVPCSVLEGANIAQICLDGRAYILTEAGTFLCIRDTAPKSKTGIPEIRNDPKGGAIVSSSFSVGAIVPPEQPKIRNPQPGERLRPHETQNSYTRKSWKDISRPG